MTSEWWSQNAYRLIMLLALAVRLVALTWIDGQVWPDEIYNSIEPAHHSAFGLGILPWEWDRGLRPWLIPWLYGALFRFADLFGASSPGDLIRIAHLLNIGLSLLVVDAAWRIANTVLNRRAAILAALFTAVAAPIVYYAPRTLADTTSAVFVVWGAALLLEAIKSPEKASPRAIYIAGIALGIAYLFRYTSPIFFAAPLIVLALQRRFKLAATLLAGFLAVALAVGFIDWFTWGTPFHSTIEYFKFSLFEGGAKRWGVQTNEWYTVVLLRDFGIASVITIVVALRGGQGTGSVGLGFLIGFVLMSHVDHKEERFLIPLWNVMPMLIALGSLRLVESMRRFGTVAAFGLGALLMASTTVAFTKKDWRPYGDWFSAVRYVGEQRDASGMYVVNDWWRLGGYVLHQRPIPMVTATPEGGHPHAAELIQNHLLNYIVVDANTAPGIVQFATQQGFEPATKIGTVSVMRRR